jgi:hypothetical protein
MKPDPLAFTSFWSRIGSPAISGSRAIEPTSWVAASGRSGRRMKLLLAVAFGLDVLAETDVGFRHQHVDRRQLHDRLGRHHFGRLGAAAGKVGGDAPGAERNAQDDNTCGLHTLLLFRAFTF